MRSRIVALLILITVLATGIAAPAAGAVPRWVKHVHKYPGGISNGVRAHLDSAAKRAAKTHGPIAPPASSALAGSLENVQMNDDSDPPLPQDETSVALNPDDPLHAVAAANDYVSGGVWVGSTDDGGETWTNERIAGVSSSGRTCQGGGDPSVAYSVRDSAFYLAQLCYFYHRPDSEIHVYQSLDQGLTWSDPSVAVTNRSADGHVDGSVFNDKELMAINNVPDTGQFGRIYLTYTKFHTLPSGRSDYCPVQLASTRNFGEDWAQVPIMRDGPGTHGLGRTANQFATPVVDEQGNLNVAFVTEECNTSTDHSILFRRSTNGGLTFGPLEKITKPGEFRDNPNRNDLLPHKRPRMPNTPSLVSNPVTGRLEIIYQNHVDAATSGADISLQRSSDHGEHWSHVKTISITGAGAPARHDQYMPWMAADEEGALHAIWFDNRRDPENRLIDTFQADSTDDGATWTNHDISTVSWNPNRSFFDCGCFIGDYNGIAASTDAIYPVWTDGRNTPGPPDGDTDIFTNVELGG